MYSNYRGHVQPAQPPTWKQISHNTWSTCNFSVTWNRYDSVWYYYRMVSLRLIPHGLWYLLWIMEFHLSAPSNEYRLIKLSWTEPCLWMLAILASLNAREPVAFASSRYVLYVESTIAFFFLDFHYSSVRHCPYVGIRETLTQYINS